MPRASRCPYRGKPSMVHCSISASVTDREEQLISKRDVVVEIVDRSPSAGRSSRAACRPLIIKTAADIALVIAAFHRRPAGAAGAPCPIQHRQLAAEAV